MHDDYEESNQTADVLLPFRVFKRKQRMRGKKGATSGLENNNRQKGSIAHETHNILSA